MRLHVGRGRRPKARRALFLRHLDCPGALGMASEQQRRVNCLLIQQEREKQVNICRCIQCDSYPSAEQDFSFQNKQDIFMEK